MLKNPLNVFYLLNVLVYFEIVKKKKCLLHYIM